MIALAASLAVVEARFAFREHIFVGSNILVVIRGKALVIDMVPKSEAADDLAARAVRGEVPNSAAEERYPPRKPRIDALVPNMKSHAERQTHHVREVAWPERQRTRDSFQIDAPSSARAIIDP